SVKPAFLARVLLDPSARTSALLVGGVVSTNAPASGAAAKANLLDIGTRRGHEGYDESKVSKGASLMVDPL
ncbi:hypothetical protein BGZ52_000472, partial [Haplosporangium bisporale]